MALVNNQQVLEATDNSHWHIIETQDLPADNLLPTISLIELLNSKNDGDEKVNIILPISSLLNTSSDSGGADSLAVETLKLIQANSNQIAVWLNTEHDYKNPYQASEQQLTDLLNATSRKAKKINPLLADLVEKLELIVLNVPLFANGRAFSLAQHLRQHGYTGEIRLTGAFGGDQLAYYHRSGVDSYVVSDDELNKGQGQSKFFTRFSALAGSTETARKVTSLPMFR